MKFFFSFFLFLFLCCGTPDKKYSELETNITLSPEEAELVLDKLERGFINSSSVRFGNLSYFEYFKLKKILNKSYSAEKLKVEPNPVSDYFQVNDLNEFVKKSDFTVKLINRLISNADSRKENADIGKRIAVPTGYFLTFASFAAIIVMASNPQGAGLVTSKEFLGIEYAKTTNLIPFAQAAGVGLFGWITSNFLGKDYYEDISNKCNIVLSYKNRISQYTEDSFWRNTAEIKSATYLKMFGELKAIWESIASKYDTCYKS